MEENGVRAESEVAGFHDSVVSEFKRRGFLSEIR